MKKIKETKRKNKTVSYIFNQNCFLFTLNFLKDASTDKSRPRASTDQSRPPVKAKPDIDRRGSHQGIGGTTQKEEWVVSTPLILLTTW